MSLLDQVKAALTSGDALNEALRVTIEHFHTESGTIHLLEPDGVLHLKAASQSIPPVVRQTVMLVPVGKGMAGLAVERKQPVSVCNLQTDASGDVRPGAKATGMEGAIVVPMFHRDEAIGALGIANRTERIFSEEDTALLIEVGRTIAMWTSEHR